MVDFVSEINLVLASLSFCLTDIDKDFIRSVTMEEITGTYLVLTLRDDKTHFRLQLFANPIYRRY